MRMQFFDGSRSTGQPPRRFIFLLLERFSLVSFSSALDALRLANRHGPGVRYTWRLAGQGGLHMASSSGTRVCLDMGLDAVQHNDMILVCGGIDVRSATTRPVLNWLRREARKGNPIGGLCTGSYALARAGLLNGKSCTIHWENRDSFHEEFPDVELKRSVFVVDGNRYSSAGGTASLDLMLKLIADDLGQDTANWIADQLVYAAMRTDRDEQRLSVPVRIGIRHPKLSAVIQEMEANIEEPMSPRILAHGAGMSTRQLERLFRRYMDRSPKRYYMDLRLQKARNLLMQTDMSVINVALACGFTSPSHFSKCYRAHYGTTPYRERGKQTVTHSFPGQA